MIGELYNWRAILFGAVGLIGVLATWAFVARTWSKLPPTIACHFDLLGRPDSWGSKKCLWILAALATVIYIGVAIIALLVPGAHEARPADLEFLAAINAYTVWMLFFTNKQIVAVAGGKRTGLGKGFCPALLGGLAILIAVYSGKIG